jgi:hypothetical protein
MVLIQAYPKFHCTIQVTIFDLPASLTYIGPHKYERTYSIECSCFREIWLTPRHQIQQKILEFNLLEKLPTYYQAKLQINTQVKACHYINYTAHDVLWT